MTCLFLFTDIGDFSIAGVSQDLTQNTDFRQPTAVVTWTDMITVCGFLGSYTITLSHNSSDAFPIGQTIVTYTAVDEGSNMVTQSFTITVEGKL